MRRSLILVFVMLAACGGEEAEKAPPPEAAPSRLEAGATTIRTARDEIEAGQRQSQARLDSQMRAAMDTAAP